MHAIANQISAAFANAMAADFIFLMDPLCFVKQRRKRRLPTKSCEATIERPCKVDRGGASGKEHSRDLACSVEQSTRHRPLLPHAEVEPVCCGNANRRGTAHREAADRVGHTVHVVQ